MINIRNILIETKKVARCSLIRIPVFAPVLVSMFYATVAKNAAAARVLEGLTVTSIDDFIRVALCTIASYMFFILIALSVIFVIIAAYQYLTSRGDETKVGNATKTITYAAVAIVVVLLAKGFPLVVASVFSYNLLPEC